jgi:hypothetical protein
MLYKVYGFFRCCEKCNDYDPYAIGITHQNSTLRLIKYRCLRKNYTPDVIKQYPKNFVLLAMHENLEWEDAFTLVEGYKNSDIRVLTCSRT